MKDNLKEHLDGHSKHYIKMALRTDRLTSIENADGYGKRTGQCGDTVEIFLKMSDNTIDKICFQVNGCLNTNACANTLADMAQGKTMKQAWNIIPDDIIDYLETLPKHETHCAELSCGAFYLALKNTLDLKHNSWKKNYT